MMGAALLLLDEADNVVVVRRAVQAGARLVIDDVPCTAAADVGVGHKLARADLATGSAVFKFGARIGVMTANVPRGGHVHTHNLASEYIPAHGRGGSDVG